MNSQVYACSSLTRLSASCWRQPAVSEVARDIWTYLDVRHLTDIQTYLISPPDLSRSHQKTSPIIRFSAVAPLSRAQSDCVDSCVVPPVEVISLNGHKSEV